MLKIKYINGLYDKANKLTFKDFGQVGNTIVMVKNEGKPFRGHPDEMALDALIHVNEEIGYEVGIYPVVTDSSEIIDRGTTEVIFQAIF